MEIKTNQIYTKNEKQNKKTKSFGESFGKLEFEIL